MGTAFAPREVARLASAAVDGGIADDDLDRLESLLLANPDARELYYCLIDLHADLAWELGGGDRSVSCQAVAPPVVETDIPVSSARRSPVLGFLASVSNRVPGGEWVVGSLVVLVVVAAFWGLANAYYSRLDTSPPSSARIVASKDAQWITPPHKSEIRNQQSEIRNQQSEITRGESLALASGVVELKLKQGVTLRIEGPAEWSIDGENRATLQRGKLLASVPKRAIGFTVETPQAQIVDLGTEFGVTVDVQGRTQTKVFKGQIALEAQSSATVDTAQQPSPLRLTAGEAALVDGQGTITPIQDEVATAEQFIRAPRPQSSEERPPYAQLEPPCPYSKAILATPGLVGYWRLGEDGTQGARDEVEFSKTHPLGRSDGVLASFHPSDYRQPGAINTNPTRKRGEANTNPTRKRGTEDADNDNYAIHFNGESYIEIGNDLALEGDWDGLTLMAWIKPEPAASDDSYSLIVGKWASAIADDAFGLLYHHSGQLHLGVGNGIGIEQGMPGVGNVPIGSDAFHFAVGTWEKATGNYRLYVDGQADLAQGKQTAPCQINTKSNVPVLIGAQRANSTRYFAGAIDEVSIFSRALSAAEIQTLYQASRSTPPTHGTTP